MTSTGVLGSIPKAWAFLRCRPHLYQLANLLRYAVSSRWPVVSYRPLYLYVSITRRCQFQCEMCHSHSARSPYRAPSNSDMSFETYRSVVDTFKDAANIAIVADGEPLLHRRFFDMVSYAKEVRRARVTTLTNGCFPPADADRLLRSGLDLVSISLKGADAPDFGRLTRLDERVYHRIVDNVRLLAHAGAGLSRRPRLAVSFILDRCNHAAIGAMLDLAESLGVDEVKFDPFLPLPVAGLRLQDRCITSADGEIMRVMRDTARREHRVAVRPPAVLDLDARGVACSSFFKVVRVATDGRVSGCLVSREELVSGHMFNDPAVWNSSYYQNMRSLFVRRDHYHLPTVCRECYQYCGRPAW